MSLTLEQHIDAGIATLTKLLDAPVQPFGYGVDWSCVEDCTENYREVDPFSRTAISEALVRRLITPRGSLIDDQEYGFDIRGLLNRGLGTAELRSMKAKIEQELLKDERVEAVTATVLQPSLNRLDISIAVTPADSSQTFDLVFALTDAGVLLERIAA